MKNKFNKNLLIVLLVMFSMLFSINLDANAKGAFKRLSGNDRYETSTSISSYGWQNADVVVLASGQGFADALCASPLAKKYNAPILLNESKVLNEKLKQELIRLKTKNVIIIGGNGSISQNVENQIKSLKISTTRIFGKDRFDTSVQIAKEIGIQNGFVVTNGQGFADALSIATVAANKQMPILLTASEKLPQTVKEYISKSKYTNCYILGGNAVVSSNVEKDLKNIKRLKGNNRYETNSVVLNEFYKGKNIDKLFLAAGSNYPDALSGSALASKSNSPILLVSNKLEISQVSFLNKCNINSIVALGGSAVVSDLVIHNINHDDTATLDGLKVHYINVGQGDSILIQQNGHNMLIDAGTNASETTVVNYLNKVGVKALDYVIGTHPHEDHIGGLDKVIDNFNIGKVILPKITANTATFKSVVTSIKNKNLTVISPKVGEQYAIGNASFVILAPNGEKYDNVNNYSVVIKLKYKNNSFLFTGDAAEISEEEMITKNVDLSADVLKVGHHGSRTSSTKEFINKVNPKYAVISVGKGNTYGHPTQEALSRLKDKNIKVYRTDESGTIIATSNGENITFNCDANNASNKVNESSNDKHTTVSNTMNTTKVENVKSTTYTGKYYVTNKGKFYHKEGCRALSRSKQEITLDQALKSGYTACKVCN